MLTNLQGPKNIESDILSIYWRNVDRPRSLLEELVKLREVTRGRTGTHPQSDFLYFGIVGMASGSSHGASWISGVAEFHAVQSPTEDQAQRVIVDPNVRLAVMRYAPHISFELEISKDDTGGGASTRALAFDIVTALRIRTNAEFVVPAVSDTPWGEFGTAQSNSVNSEMLEDVPTFRPVIAAGPISTEDFDWAFDNCLSVHSLNRHWAFALAQETYCLARHSFSPRTIMPMLWSGIQALFDLPEKDVTFFLTNAVADVLEPPGPKRSDLQQALKELYKSRSEVVHGEPVDTAEQNAHIFILGMIFSRLLRTIVEGPERRSRLRNSLIQIIEANVGRNESMRAADLA